MSYIKDQIDPAILWTNCADDMPPDDETFKLIVVSPHGRFISDGYTVNEFSYEAIPENHIWTPYTDKKWKELNKGGVSV